MVIRKNAEDLSDWTDRAYRFYLPLGAKITGKPPTIEFPSGAKIRTGHLKDDQAYTKYQGHEYQRELIEELTQIPDERRYLQLISSCRTTIKEIKTQVFATTNPGGLGHGWVKKRFIDPSPPTVPFFDKTSGRSRIFIPSTVDDNPALQEADPLYIKQLDALKDVDIELWKAWRLGDWNTFAGQFFKEWRTDLHTCNPFVPTKDYVFVGGLDWGRVDSFACLFYAIKEIDFDGVRFNRAWQFCEVYGNDKTPKEWAVIIKQQLHRFNLTLSNINWIQADNQIFTPTNDRSKSIALQFQDVDERFRILKAASKERIGGWENIHNWLSIAPDGLPYLMVATNCHNTITTLPELVHDDALGRVEDVMGGSQDHAADAMRYALKAVRWIDAKVGAFGMKQIKRTAPVAITEDGRQVSIDLGKFANIKSR